MVWVYDHTQSVLVAMLMHVPIIVGNFVLLDSPGAGGGARPDLYPRLRCNAVGPRGRSCRGQPQKALARRAHACHSTHTRWCEYVMNEETARRSMSERVRRSPAHDDHNASRWKVRWRVSEAMRVPAERTGPVGDRVRTLSGRSSITGSWRSVTPAPSMRTLSTGYQRPHPRIITRRCPFHLLTATTGPKGQLTCVVPRKA